MGLHRLRKDPFFCYLQAPLLGCRSQNETRLTWTYPCHLRLQAADDLSFRKDDIIVITEEANSDWWKGYVSNNPSRIGLFPSNYTTRLYDPSNRFVCHPLPIFRALTLEYFALPGQR